MYGTSKGAALNKFLADLVTLAEAFTEQSTEESIVKNGEKILVSLYHGGLVEEGLGLRFRKFTRKIMESTTHVQVQTLPPTSRAAKYHSLRSYFQVQEWIEADPRLLPTE
ncbi:hypothetical protein DPMN_138865 [Dreissena polymorpha]|uniref:Uncharacterized protein n=1 Tax=Dreissena polymorpha TaxID=45954 RepID=A0A9D4JF40_DREPO|nr:hypothetical protein DPMN_138865 [Dreissena polymorpha]